MRQSIPVSFAKSSAFNTLPSRIYELINFNTRAFAALVLNLGNSYIISNVSIIAAYVYAKAF